MLLAMPCSKILFHLQLQCKEGRLIIMKMGRGKLLSVLLFYIFMHPAVLVHSSTESHSVSVKTKSAFEETNFTRASEFDKVAGDSSQYYEQIAKKDFGVSPPPVRANPIVEGPGNAEVETDGDQSSGPGVGTFWIFFVVIAWLTTVGGPKEN